MDPQNISPASIPTTMSGAASTAAGLLFVLLVGDISNGTGNTGSGLHKSSALDGKKAR